jgi:hypothetical protein
MQTGWQRPTEVNMIPWLSLQGRKRIEYWVDVTGTGRQDTFGTSDRTNCGASGLPSISPNDVVDVHASFHEAAQREITEIIGSHTSDDADPAPKHRQLDRCVRRRPTANANVILSPVFLMLRRPPVRNKNEIDIYRSYAKNHLSVPRVNPRSNPDPAIKPKLMLLPCLPILAGLCGMPVGVCLSILENITHIKPLQIEQG